VGEPPDRACPGEARSSRGAVSSGVSLPRTSHRGIFASPYEPPGAFASPCDLSRTRFLPHESSGIFASRTIIVLRSNRPIFLQVTVAVVVCEGFSEKDFR